MQQNRTHRWRALFAVALAAALVAWFLRDANPAEVWSEIRRAQVGYLGLGAAAMVMGYLLRVVRWRYLLQPVGPTSFAVAARATVIGYAAMVLLPARAGDILRPYVLARQEGLRATSVFATVVMERVLDLMVVLAMLGAFVWWAAGDIGGPPALLHSVRVSGLTAGAAAVALFGLLQVLAWHPERLGAFILRARRVLPHRIADRVADAARAFGEGLAVARTPRPFGWAAAWSLPIWLLSAVQIWWVSLAFGIDMPFAGSFLQQALLVVGIAIPTPGGVGSFHEAYRVGATVFFGGSEQAAIGAAIVLHALSFLPITVLGVAFMVRDGLTVGRLQRLADEDETEATEDEVPVLRPSGR